MSKQIVHVNTIINLNLFMLETFNIKQTYHRTYPRARTQLSLLIELSVFELLFTVVISEKSCFEQKNAWSRFALISLTV